MPISSSSLFHYTRGGIEAIKGILENGFRIKYNREAHPYDIAQGVRLRNGEAYESEYMVKFYQDSRFAIKREHYLHIPMVSFCDIPVTLIPGHLENYGTNVEQGDKKIQIGYAIGMKKSWGIQNNLNPLLYLVPGGTLAKSFFKSVDLDLLESIKVKNSTDDHLDTEMYMEPVWMGDGDLLRDNKGNQFPRVALYVKPLGMSYEMVGKTYKYIDEREWRYIPNDAQIVHSLDFSHFSTHNRYFSSVRFNAERALNDANKYANLKFGIDDINHIIVGNDSEVPEIQKHLKKVFCKGRGENEDKVFLLYSKVISYESLKNDFFSH